MTDTPSTTPGDPTDPAATSTSSAPTTTLPLPGDAPTSGAGASPATGATDAGAGGGAGTDAGAPPAADPEGADAQVEMPEPSVVEPPVDGPLEVADVPAGQTVTGVNPADGRPTVTDPAYRDSGDAGTVESRLLAQAIATNADLTDAERTSGEVTVSSAGKPTGEPIDATLIGMGTAVEYRPRKTIRVMRVDYPFTVDGEDGVSGDYLAEDPDGHRHKLTAAELSEHFVLI